MTAVLVPDAVPQSDQAASRPLLGRTPSAWLRRVRTASVLLGPAFVAGIAYVDPGNVATNLSAGSRFGYQLVWVVVLANAAAVLVQSLAAKLGLATGRNLAEISRERYRRPVNLALWAQAELVAVATDLAEIVGGALALQLLVGLPMLPGALITAAFAYLLLTVRSRDARRFELVVAGLFAIIAAGFGYLTVRARPDGGAFAAGLVPGFSGADSVLLASAMIGATIMPHAMYVHSALTQDRPRPADRRRALKAQRLDIAAAMGAAGLVNLAMVVLGAAVVASRPNGGDIVGMHAELGRTLGGMAGFVFAVALLSSGLASSGVGTFAGEVVMGGYLRRRIPRPVRRACTLAPTLALLALGVSATQALIASQVVISFGVPFALIALVAATRDRRLMGDLVNRRVTTACAVLITAVIGGLNAYLLIDALR